MNLGISCDQTASTPMGTDLENGLLGDEVPGGLRQLVGRNGSTVHVVVATLIMRAPVERNEDLSLLDLAQLGGQLSFAIAGLDNDKVAVLRWANWSGLLKHGIKCRPTLISSFFASSS